MNSKRKLNPGEIFSLLAAVDWPDEKYACRHHPTIFAPASYTTK